MKIVVRLVSWLGAHLTSGSHNAANLHPILEIKVSKSKLGFVYLMIKILCHIYLKLFSFLWDTLYDFLSTQNELSKYGNYIFKVSHLIFKVPMKQKFLKKIFFDIKKQEKLRSLPLNVS